MELSGHFTYNGRSSREYGLMLANAETKRDLRAAGDIATVSVFDKKGVRNCFLSDEYSDSPLAIEIEVLCDGDKPLNVFAQREIKKWLFHSQGYGELYIDMQDDPYGENFELVNGEQKRLYLNCRFTEPQKIEGNGGVCGFRATIETDSPFAWMDAVTAAYTLSGAANGVIVNVTADTDMKAYTYPKVTFITGSSGGDVTVQNLSDDVLRLTGFTGLTANTQVIMTGEISMISGQNYEKFSNKNFIRLIDGNNRIAVTGDVVSIQFEWQNRRYL